MSEAGYLSPKAVFVDGTHIKANANTKKQVKKEVPVADRFSEMETVVADSAYKTPRICKKVFDDDRVLSSAYKRPQHLRKLSHTETEHPRKKLCENGAAPYLEGL